MSQRISVCYDNINDDDKVQCDNCDWSGTVAELVQSIADPSERLSPGCEIPAGECPECGALAYLIMAPEEKE